MSNRDNIIGWADENEKDYADDYIATSSILREHGVYELMGSYLTVATTGYRQRYAIPEDRPVVHIDIGSGVGDALGEMSEHLKEKHILIGIDINQHMCRAAVHHLLEQGHTVESHIHQNRRLSRKKGRQRLERTFPIQQQEIDKMDLTPNGRIVIIQDDIRKQGSVLDTILEELRTRHNINHVDSISFAQPGLSGAAVISGKTKEDIRRFQRGWEGKETAGSAYMHELIDAINRRAKELLGFGGSYTVINRLDNANALRDVYNQVTGNELPNDEAGQTFARMLVAGLMLRKGMQDFRLASGAIIYPDYHTVEQQTPIAYASFSPQGQQMNRDRTRTYDLFALTLLRSDLHPLGPNAAAFGMTISRKGEDEEDSSD